MAPAAKMPMFDRLQSSTMVYPIGRCVALVPHGFMPPRSLCCRRVVREHDWLMAGKERAQAEQILDLKSQLEDFRRRVQTLEAQLADRETLHKRLQDTQALLQVPWTL